MKGFEAEEINKLAGHEAVNAKPDGESDEEYEIRMTKIKEGFGLRRLTLEEQRQIAIREAIISTAIQTARLQA